MTEIQADTLFNLIFCVGLFVLFALGFLCGMHR